MKDVGSIDSGRMEVSARGRALAGPGQKGNEGPDHAPPSRRIAFRDLIIFQIKLALDGVGDLILAPLAVIAFLVDLIPGRRSGRTFYRVLRFGERWDRWLSLYRPAHEAGGTEEGLLGAGQIDADTFLGKVEEVVGRKGRRSGSDADH